jgi:hypothetical protein
VTNRAGEYVLEALRPGQYYVSAVLDVAAENAPQRGGGPAPTFGYGHTIYPGSSQLAYASPVRLSPAGEVTSIDIRLEKNRLARVTGRVTATRDLTDGDTSIC